MTAGREGTGVQGNLFNEHQGIFPFTSVQSQLNLISFRHPINIFHGQKSDDF